MYNAGVALSGTRAGDELRGGLIGFGLAGSVFHAPPVPARPGRRLAAVGTSNPERYEQARREHAGALVLETPEQLWGVSRELDLVVVASPNSTHAALARAALGAGLAVVVDKPLAA